MLEAQRRQVSRVAGGVTEEAFLCTDKVAQVALHRGDVRLRLRVRELRDRDRGKNADDDDHDQQLDQCESFPSHWNSPGMVARCSRTLLRQATSLPGLTLQVTQAADITSPGTVSITT